MASRYGFSPQRNSSADDPAGSPLTLGSSPASLRGFPRRVLRAAATAPAPSASCVPVPATGGFGPVFERRDVIGDAHSGAVSVDRQTGVLRASGLRLRRLAGSGRRTEVAGVAQYQPVLRRLAGGRTVAPGAFADAVASVAVLVPDPYNPHDPLAVAVQLLDDRGTPRTVGHLTREVAAACHHRLAGLDGGAHGYCAARIMGGGTDRRYSVHLHWSPDVVATVHNDVSRGYLLVADGTVTAAKLTAPHDGLARYAPRDTGPTGVIAQLSFLPGGETGRAWRPIVVALDGVEVGELAEKPSRRYASLVAEIGRRGAPAWCEAAVYRQKDGLGLYLHLPNPPSTAMSLDLQYPRTFVC